MPREAEVARRDDARVVIFDAVVALTFKVGLEVRVRLEASVARTAGTAATTTPRACGGMYFEMTSSTSSSTSQAQRCVSLARESAAAEEARSFGLGAGGSGEHARGEDCVAGIGEHMRGEIGVRVIGVCEAGVLVADVVRAWM